jgi:sterol desaturase/sphingolipid hydroxylase (fatty acid hydroxylase superfamily)
MTMKIEEVLGLAFPVTYLLMYVTEKIWPRRSYPKVRGWGVIGILLTVLMMSVGIAAPMFIPVEWLATHRLIDGSKLGVIGGTVVGFLVFELGVYVYHRSCHRFSFMWRAVHQMHHAPQRLDMPGAVLFHPLELVLQNVIMIGVTVFLLGLDPLAAAIIGYLAAFYGLFQHWNIKTPRWLGYVIQRPEAHGHHHEENVHAGNYADLPLWDILFGSFKNPETFEGNVGFGKKPTRRRRLDL